MIGPFRTFRHRWQQRRGAFQKQISLASEFEGMPDQWLTHWQGYNFSQKCHNRRGRKTCQKFIDQGNPWNLIPAQYVQYELKTHWELVKRFANQRGAEFDWFINHFPFSMHANGRPYKTSSQAPRWASWNADQQNVVNCREKLICLEWLHNNSEVSFH